MRRAIMDNKLVMDNWLLLFCKARQEQRAQQHLMNQGIESYFPTITVNKLRAGKRVQAIEALFPRYLFIKNHEQLNLAAVRSTRGVNGLVRFGESLAYVSADLVQQLIVQQTDLQKKMMQQQVFRAGEKLQILTGPFAMLNAIYQMPDGENRSFVLLNFLGQSTRLPIENSALERLEPLQLLTA